MPDWKILVAAIVILLVAGFFLFGAADVIGFFSDSIGRIGDFLAGSPFGDLFSLGPETSEATITFYPAAFNFSLDTPTDIMLGDSRFTAFTGTATVDFAGDLITLAEHRGLEITSRVVDTEFADFRFSSMVLEGMRVEVMSGQWTMTSDNGTIEIRDFAGAAFIHARNQSVSFVGNVSLVEQR